LIDILPEIDPLFALIREIFSAEVRCGVNASLSLFK
jgi:hypothetical protein